MSEAVRELAKMYDNVEREYQEGIITWEEKESRQFEIMMTWRQIQP